MQKNPDMEQDVVDWSMTSVGTIALEPAIFATTVRPDLIKRVIDWQRAKRRAGSHCSRRRSEIQVTGKKLNRQKGTGRARHGSRASNIFRGGAKAFAPMPRSYETKLPKAIRRMALCSALAAKLADQAITFVDNQPFPSEKTRDGLALKAKLACNKMLLILDDQPKLALAIRNLPWVNVLPVAGVNVYDLIRHDRIVISTQAVAQLTDRLLTRPKAA